MAEATPNAAPQPAQAVAGQPTGGGGFQVPDGQMLVSKTDWEGAQREAAKVKGFTPFYERAKKLGFEKPEDFDSFEPVVQTIRERKIDPKGFSSMFSREAEDELRGGDKPQAQFDAEKFKAELKAEGRKERAMEQRDEGFKSLPKLVDSALGEWFKDNKKATNFDKGVMKRAFTDFLWENCDRYPDDHPLKGEPAPFTESHVKKALEYFAKERTDAQASGMVAKGDAALNTKAKPASSAGPGGGQGGPKDDDSRKTPKETLEESIERRLEGAFR